MAITDEIEYLGGIEINIQMPFDESHYPFVAPILAAQDQSPIVTHKTSVFFDILESTRHGTCIPI